MAAGRKTGGRVAGTPNRATAAREAEIAASGQTPLQFMLEVMRDPDAGQEIRLDAAKAAAPYVHPKLSAVQVSDPEGNAVPVMMGIVFVDPDS